MYTAKGLAVRIPNALCNQCVDVSPSPSVNGDAPAEDAKEPEPTSNQLGPRDDDDDDVADELKVQPVSSVAVAVSEDLASASDDDDEEEENKEEDARGDSDLEKDHGAKPGGRWDRTQPRPPRFWPQVRCAARVCAFVYFCCLLLESRG